jgi:hypothetical protein
MMMKNEYDYDGEIIYISINSPKYGQLMTKVSRVHLERLKELDRSITVRYDSRMRSFYAAFKLNDKQVSLHRWITDAPKGTHVDHQNSDTLDNTDENLNVCSPLENKRKKRRNIINKSGVRGVHWCNTKKKWIGQVRSLGEHYYVGQFDSLEEAEKATEAKRKELWGYA